MAQNAQNKLDDLYGDVVLEHCRSPRNNDMLDVADRCAEGVNPFCGDEVHLQINLMNDHISRVGIQSQGCSINRASASMMSQAIEGKTLCEIEALSLMFRAMMNGDALSEEGQKALAELTVMTHVLEFPVRIKCALLPWITLEDVFRD